MPEIPREEQLVVFRLADESYGLEIASVQEIITWQPVTRVPRTVEFIEGIINLRGNVIPVLDLRKRFQLPTSEMGRDTRIIVVEIGSLVVGLAVDGVSEVLRVAGEGIEPPSELISGVDTEFIRGVAKADHRLIILLDAGRILNWHERAALTAELRQPRASAEPA